MGDESGQSGNRLLGWAVLDSAVVLGATLVAPLWMLLLAPLLLGVPHVAADLRYLVLRPGLKLRAAAAMLTPLLAMTVLRALGLLGFPMSPRVDVLLGLLAVAGGMWAAPAGGRMRARLAFLLVLAGGLALSWPKPALLALVHGHNAVAVALVIVWGGLGLARGTILFGLVGVAAALVWSGVVTPWSLAPFAGLRLQDLTTSLAPGLSAHAARGLALTFAFGQALHFAAWLHLIPIVRRGPSLRADFGAEALVPLGLLALVVPAAGLLDPVGVRNAYLSLVSFHAWLEVAALAHQGCTRLSSG